MFMLAPLILSFLAADEGVSRAVPAPGMGGAVAPAALGAGTIALYGQVGAPELAVGFRQGFAPFELEARLSFDLLEVASVLEGGVKVGFMQRGPLQLAAGAMLGVRANSGATYYDLGNFASWALRPAAVGVLSYALSDVVGLVAKVEVPLAISLNVHGLEFAPTLALGGEFLLGQGVSLLVLGKLGPAFREGPSGLSQTRAAWGLQLGVGYRVF